MTLSLGFSPCPNDCFMFDAIVHRRIDLEGLEFAVHLADVEALNKAAFAGDADVTKLSYHAYAYCAARYALLDAGSALGRNCGPLLISKRAIARDEVASGRLRIAIPGKYTTASFLASRFPPRARPGNSCSRKSRRRCSGTSTTPGSSSTRTGSRTKRRA
jgi:1,4-dihydroxy-6-naphthoate synthase